MFDLTGKVSIVTGSSRGIGKGVAKKLAEAGSDIILNCYSGGEEGELTKAEIEAIGRQVLLVRADVSKEEEVVSLFQNAMEFFGRVDVLVNNAGTSQDKDIFDTQLSDWEHILQVNLTSTFLCSKYAMEIMKKQIGGRIIQISSVVAERGAIHGHVHYAATKSGQIGFTKTLARTGAPFHITVNAIAPGVIETELLYKTHGAEGVQELAKTIPLGLGKVEDIGAAAVFLASEEARYITGATLDINGGMHFR